MNPIIGLCERETAVSPTVERLKSAGIPAERIQVLSNAKTITSMLGINPIDTIKKYMIWGVAIGVGGYAIFGLLAAHCECQMMQYGQAYGIFALLGAIFAGTFLGGFLGFVVGAGEAETETHLYTQGVAYGGKVISVQAPEAEIEHVQDILAEENVLGIRVLQTAGV
jgi:hypothetical protein